MIVTLYDSLNNELLATELESGSNLKRTLGKEDCVVLKFSLVDPIIFPIGTYVILEDMGGLSLGRFELSKIYVPKYSTKADCWEYEMQLDAPYWGLKNKILKYNPEDSSNETSWGLTAALETHLAIVKRNLVANNLTYNGIPYSIVLDETVPTEPKLMTYDNQSILDALIAIADEWKTEFWVEKHEIKFGRCEAGGYIDFEMGMKCSSMEPQSTRSNYATRIYAFGAARNLPVNYRPTQNDVVVNGIVQKRLMLPESVPYIDAVPGLNNAEIVEGVLTFDDIYPRFTAGINSVTIKKYDVTDDDGKATGEKWTVYRYKDTSISFREDYILPGVDLQVQFQDGLLAGMIFNVKFNPDNVKDETSSAAQVFEIIRNEEYGRPLPDETLKPCPGDKVILIGWDSTKIADLNMVDTAEQELLERAMEQVEKLKRDPNSYKCKLISESLFDNDGNYHLYNLGQKIRLISEAFFTEGERSSRIIGMDIDLLQPFNSPQYVVGEECAYSRLNALEQQVETLTYKGQIFTGGGGGIYIIRRNDNTPYADDNVLSSLRSKNEFLSRLVDDICAGLITFEQGLRIGDYIAGSVGRGAAIDAEGNAEVESIKVRSAMEVRELIINRLQALEGDQILTENDTVASVADNGNGAYTLTLRPKWGGYTTAFRVGDIVKGIINTLAAGNGVYHTSWMHITAVNTADNKLTVQIYADSDTPAGANYGPGELMKIARWGHISDPTRQSCFYLSSTEGRIVRLTGVDSPKVTDANYGTIIGKLPDGFLADQNLPLQPGVDYAYMRGVVVQDLVRCDYAGDVIPGGMTAGNNILLQTGFKNLSEWARTDGTVVGGIEGVNAFKSSDPGTDSYTAMLEQSVVRNHAMQLIDDTWYVLSFYAKVDGKLSVYIRDGIVDISVDGIVDGRNRRFNSGNDDIAHVQFTAEAAPQWRYHTIAFKTTNSISSEGNKYIRWQQDGAGQSLICMPKLERGTTATAWQPNADDLKGADGTNGQDGTSIKIKGTLASTADLPASPADPFDCYIIGLDIYVWDGNVWVNAGQFKGAKGDPGLPGRTGTSSYLHIRYSAVPNPASADQMSTTPDKYIGTCVTTSILAPNTPSAYSWRKFQGDDGEKGAAVRGPFKYSRLPADWLFQSGQPGEEFVDVVVMEDNAEVYWRCRVSGFKNALPAPSASASDYWAQSSKWPIVATDLMLADMADINNLRVSHVRTGGSYLENGETIERARIEIDNGQIRAYGVVGEHPNIIFGIDETTGSAVIKFYDNEGHPLYDLGPHGIVDSVISGVEYDPIYLRRTHQEDSMELGAAQVWIVESPCRTYYTLHIPIDGVDRSRDGLTLQDNHYYSASIVDGQYVECFANGAIAWRKDAVPLGGVDLGYYTWRHTYLSGRLTSSEIYYMTEYDKVLNQPT